MARLPGLHFVIAAVILHIQTCNAAVIRDLETTTTTADTTPQVSTMADSTIPQDIIGQTTLPPILFRSDTDTDTTTDTTESTDNQTSPDIHPKLSGELLSRSEPTLGWKSTLADTSTVDSDATLVPTTQLVPVDGPVPEVGEQDRLVKISTTEKTTSVPEKLPQTTTSVPETSEVQQSGLPIHQSKPIVTILNKEPSFVPEAASIPRRVQETVSIPQIVPEKATTDSFLLPTVQIMAYVIDTLWEKEHKNMDDGYKVTEDVNETKDDWEDDDMSKPVFQTNVPIVNSESVPMRMHMDIIPQGFPEDLEGSMMYYPDYYDDKDAKNDLGKLTEQSWSKDDVGDADNIQDEAKANVERFETIQQQMRFFRYLDTFDKLVELHRDLAVYAKKHDTEMHSGFSERVTDVLRKNTENAASQLKTVISMISDEIEEEPLHNSLKKFQENLSETNSESFVVLSSLPAMHYS